MKHVIIIKHNFSILVNVLRALASPNEGDRQIPTEVSFHRLNFSCPSQTGTYSCCRSSFTMKSLFRRSLNLWIPSILRCWRFMRFITGRWLPSFLSTRKILLRNCPWSVGGYWVDSPQESHLVDFSLNRILLNCRHKIASPCLLMRQWIEFSVSLHQESSFFYAPIGLKEI